MPFVAAPVTTEEAPPPPPQTAPVPTTTTPPPPSSLPDADRPDDDPRPGRHRPTPAAARRPGSRWPWWSPGWPWWWARPARRRCGPGAGGGAVAGRRPPSIDGAWRETLDGLAAYRYPVTRAMTAPEVLAVAAAHAGAPVPAAAGELARLANDARYGPAASPPEAAGDAWRRSAEVLAWARRRCSPRVRARAFVDVGAALRGAR